MLTDNRVPCRTNESAFFADGLDPSRVHATTGDARILALDSLTDVVETVVDAISACTHCPLLQTCRAQTAKEISENLGPAGIVRSGLYWGFDGKPDFTLSGCVDAASANQARTDAIGTMKPATRVDEHGNEWPLTVSVRAHYPPATVEPSGPVNHDLGQWDLSWLPALPDQLNMFAINAALDPDLGVPVVTERWMARHGTSVPDSARSAEVMSDADVAEYLRRAERLEISPRRLAATLRMRWESVQDLRRQLGIIPGTTPLQCPTIPADVPQEEHCVDYTGQWNNADEGQQLALV